MTLLVRRMLFRYLSVIMNYYNALNQSTIFSQTYKWIYFFPKLFIYLICHWNDLFIRRYFSTKKKQQKTNANYRQGFWMKTKHQIRLKFSFSSFYSTKWMTGNQTDPYFFHFYDGKKTLFFLIFFWAFFSSIFRFLSPLLFYQTFRCD
jgi:hypothetical protein